ncbi:MAG TPA: RagB/SusD family nutrient uptake outer membrane protein, partial [Puia sp.]
YGLIPLFSMEEVLMNRAEAYARTSNNTAALADLNAWVSKNIKNYNPGTHNVTTTKASNFYGLPATNALIQTALDFKRFTYFQEGIRWLDNIRLGMTIYRFNGADFSTPIAAIPPGDNRRVLQLPPEAIADGLEPNPK